MKQGEFVTIWEQIQASHTRIFHLPHDPTQMAWPRFWYLYGSWWLHKSSVMYVISAWIWRVWRIHWSEICTYILHLLCSAIKDFVSPKCSSLIWMPHRASCCQNCTIPHSYSLSPSSTISIRSIICWFVQAGLCFSVAFWRADTRSPHLRNKVNEDWLNKEPLWCEEEGQDIGNWRWWVVDIDIPILFLSGERNRTINYSNICALLRLESGKYILTIILL